MGKFNLSEAAKNILSEGSKETFASNVAAKKKGQETGVGDTKLSGSDAYGTKEAGLVGQSPEKLGDTLPAYTSGTPSATPPGATPPVGSEKDGVGATKATGPADSQGSEATVDQKDATSYDDIRDRKKYKAPAQTFEPTPGSKGVEVYGEDIDALMQGEELSEDFKQKAATIFEAAVNARAEEHIAIVESQLTEQFQEAVEQIKEDLASKVDDYLNYMVEEWIKENEIAIEKGLRAEIVEDFIGALRNVFVEHYIDIPSDKVDVVEELTAKVEELEASLNEQISTAVEMKKEINEHKKIEAIHAVCEGLTQTQVEKMKSLAEGVEFTTEDEFADKLATIKESYFKAQVKTADSSALDDEVQIEEEKQTTKSADPMMEQYVKSISQTLVK